MGMQEQLEAELVRAEALLVKAEATLAKAEAALEKAVIDQVDADRIDAARSFCRCARADRHHSNLRRDRVRTALAELSRAQPISSWKVETAELIEGVEKGAGTGTSRASERRASPRPTQFREESVPRVGKQQEGPGKKRSGSSARPRQRYLMPCCTTDWRLLTRRIVMLLALVLAYAQYYFLDVHLQIALLPSIAVYLWG